ncbi:MerR family transcriptional regulator [Temperatibacter marinus]|uniref:MerR family transcriptional regulator n=1 Tax=Temperatibacter marinus TaxID=1456591 RepID=A0AA52HA49_9PROT|nr:MerR family transcriptional regulator [Temperatibacter marinus]WND02243.1 MerR family transcriptional regulator [Temperatibacter marinus]
MPHKEKAYRTISEVAELLDLQQHVLRFWETKFPQIKPMKRGGNRRYYRPDDIRLLEALKILLHKDGYTIRGVQKLFKEQGLKDTITACLNEQPVEPVPYIKPQTERVPSFKTSPATDLDQPTNTPRNSAAENTPNPKKEPAYNSEEIASFTHSKSMKQLLVELSNIRDLLD